MINIQASLKEVFTQLWDQWKCYSEMWKSYELIVMLIYANDQWSPYFCYITGKFEERPAFVERLPISIEDIVLLYRVIWTSEDFEQFLEDMSKDGSFTLDGTLTIHMESSAHATLTSYAEDHAFYDPRDYDYALRYILCHAGLSAFRNSNIPYTIGLLMESKGYRGLEDMVKREFQLRNDAQIFQIVLPLGIRVEAVLQHEQIDVRIQLQESLSEGAMTVRVGENSLAVTDIKMIPDPPQGVWSNYHGEYPVETRSTSLWISHPAFPAVTVTSGSGDSQIFRIDITALELRPQKQTSEQDLVDLLFQSTGYKKEDGLKQFQGWLTQVDNKDSERASHLEVALATRFVLAGARVYNSGVGLQTRGVDMVALWSETSPPKALVVSATTKIDQTKSSITKIQSLVMVEESYRHALSGYEIIFAFAVPIKRELLPFSLIIEAARHRMAILDVDELSGLQDLNKSIAEIWKTVAQNPRNLRGLVVGEFAEISNRPYELNEYFSDY